MSVKSSFQFSKIRNIAFIFSLTFFSSAMLIGQEKSTAKIYNEGLALLKQKDYAGGLVLLEEALEKATTEENEKIIGLARKNGAVAAYNAGNAKRKANDLAGAHELHAKGIALNPDNSSNYEGQARAFEAEKKMTEAVSAYLMAGQKGEAEGKDKRAANRFKKAQNLVGKQFIGKNYELAVTLGKAFVEAKDDNPEVHYYLSRSLAETGDNEAAVSHIQKAIEQSGGAATAPGKYSFALGNQLTTLGKKAEAIAAFESITEEKYKKQADYKVTKLKG